MNYIILPPSHFKCHILTLNDQDQFLIKHKEQNCYYFKKLKITFYSILYVLYNDIILLYFQNYIICVNLSQNLVNLTIQKSNWPLKMGWREYKVNYKIVTKL